MFVVSEHLSENSNLHIYDSPFPMGSGPERSQIIHLNVLTTLKGTGAYKNFLIMSEEKEIVATSNISKECVEVCLLIKELGKQKDVSNKLFYVFTDAYDAQTSEIHGFFESGCRYVLFKALRELLAKAGKLKKQELEQLLEKIQED